MIPYEFAKLVPSMTPLDKMILAAKPILIPAEEQDMRIQEENWKVLEAAMRAALLALAETNLPGSVIEAAYAPLSIRDQAHIDMEALKIAFKSMLRAIAEEKNGEPETSF